MREKTMLRMFSVVVLVSCVMAGAQITSSANLSCTVVAGGGGMACSGLVPHMANGKNLPMLSVTLFTIEPGGVVENRRPSVDLLIIGVNGGDLLNEKPPFLHVLLEKDAVTLMPREHPFRLRNKGSKSVELRLLEVRR